MHELPTTFNAAFIFGFLGLLGIVTWAMRSLLLHTQKYVSVTIPAQQKLCKEEMETQAKLFKENMEQMASHYVKQADAERDYHRRQLELLQDRWSSAHAELTAQVREIASNWRNIQDEMAHNRRTMEQQTTVLARLVARTEKDD